MLSDHQQGAPSAETEHLAATENELTDAEIRERMSGNI
jgi:xanthine dehydrogenase YagT iron-sulfur-binding subunit